MPQYKLSLGNLAGVIQRQLGSRLLNKALNDLNKTSTITFNKASDEQNEPSIGEEFGSVAHTIVDLLASVDLFHGTDNNFDGQEFRNLVDNIERGIEHSIPYC